MSLRTIIYCLKSQTNGKTVLSYDLNAEGIIVENTLEKIVLKLDGKLFTIEKTKWVNSMRVFDVGSVFFVICTKSISTNYVFETLMKYAMSKLTTRIEFLTTLKGSYQKELDSLKLKAA